MTLIEKYPLQITEKENGVGGGGDVCVMFGTPGVANT